MSPSAPRSHPTRTVVVLGASYGGARAARLLSQSLPDGWRVVVIDRNSHMNHVYVFPRFTILPAHAPKGFVPYCNLLNPAPPSVTTTTDKARANSCSSRLRPRPPTPPLTPTSSSSSSSSHSDDEEEHEFIQGSITALHSHSVSFLRPGARTGSRTGSTSSIASIATSGTYGTFDGTEEVLHFDYAVYALGSGMPDPVNVWSEHANMPAGISREHREHGLGTKKGGVRWMERKAEQIKKAKRIVIVGGGALGIQFATDLKEVYPKKSVTLLHSRSRLMPLYPIAVHVAVVDALKKLGVDVVLGERVVTWPEDPESLDGKMKVLRTDKGRQFEADLVLPCTGQKPHSSIMAALSPSSISPISYRIRVNPSLQVSSVPIRPAGSRANTLEKLSALSLKPSSALTPPSSRETSENNSEHEDDDLSHIFAIGDVADTGAIQAGHTAHWQAEVAARNILRLIERGEGRTADDLETYKPGLPAIKVSLGLKTAVTVSGSDVKVSHDGVEDLRALSMWPLFQAGDLDVNA